MQITAPQNVDNSSASRIACTIVVWKVERASDLERTLDSASCQAGDFALDVIVLLPTQSEAAPAAERALEERPWIFNSGIISDDNDKPSPATLLTLSCADWYVVLESGDTLQTDALSRLVSGATAQACAMAVGGIRYHNNSSVWSGAGIDRYFALPARCQQSMARFLADWQGLAIAAISRAGLVATNNATDLRIFTLHEYVVRRRGSETIDERIYQRRYSLAKQLQLVAPGRPVDTLRPATKRVAGSWLFAERGGESAEDNAWALFKYCVAHLPELDCYYVISEGSRLELPKELNERILVKHSPQWEQQLTRSSHFLFTDTAADILDDATQASSYPDRHFVFLTHGYLAYSPGVYPAHHQYIDHVICSSRADVISAAEWWEFPTSRFLVTGLPRWDSLVPESSSDAREILLCPTWRKIFNSLSWSDSRELSDDDVEHFRSSHYFQALNSFLGSDELAAILDEYDLSLNVNIHFRLRKYLVLFPKVNSPRIQLSLANDGRSLAQLMQDACALITDYSSIMWDMAYMHKPVLCYQFDKAAMLWERNLEQFALPDERLLAQVCYSQPELLQALAALGAAEFDPGAVFNARKRDYFPGVPGENCARSVQAIIDSTLQLPAGSHLPPATGDINQMMSPLAATLAQPHLIGNSAVLFGTRTELPAGCTRLEPGTWREQIETGKFEQLLIEPHLDARNEWAATFFSPSAACGLIRELTELAAGQQLPITLSLPRQLPYAQQLRHLSRDNVSILAAADDPPGAAGIDISVIIPVFNGIDYIGPSIQSVLDQDFRGQLEIIVVDDGSTDDTAGVVGSYVARHDNIHLLQQRNSRQGMARNRGLLAASGTCVAFLDADDVLSAHALQRLWDTMTLHKTRVAVGLVASCTTTGASQRVNQAYYHYSRAPDTFDSNSWPHVFYDPSCVGKLYERNFLLQNAIFFPQSFHEDQAFCFKLFALNERLAVTRNIVYFYVARDDDQAPSGTQIFSSEKFRQVLLSGTLAAESLDTAPLEARVKQHALGFLVMRYDRFLWKKSQVPPGPTGREQLGQALPLLSRFLTPLDGELIFRHARHVWAALLLARAGQLELAEQAIDGESEVGLDYLRHNALLPDGISALADSEEYRWPAYKYYRSVALLDPTSPAITEMSYGYRLGYLFVESVKSPSKILAAPVLAVILLYDVVSGRGLQKQQAIEARLLRGSERALARHSEFIRLTASYQVGVALIEAFARGPRELLGLPARISDIYRRTKPDQEQGH